MKLSVYIQPSVRLYRLRSMRFATVHYIINLLIPRAAPISRVGAALKEKRKFYSLICSPITLIKLKWNWFLPHGIKIISLWNTNHDFDDIALRKLALTFVLKFQVVAWYQQLVCMALTMSMFAYQAIIVMLEGKLSFPTELWTLNAWISDYPKECFCDVAQV